MKKKRFQQKKIIICCGEKMTNFTLRPWMQVGFLMICLAAAYWVLQTSVLYFFSNDLIRSREVALSEKQSENNQLKKELAYYQSRVEQSEKLALDIQQAHKDILDKVDLLVSEEIKNAEGGFEKVEKLLKENGAPISTLLQKVKKEENVGGPYIPDMSSALLTFPYAQKLTAVYDKVDYLESLVTLSDRMPLGYPISETRISAAFGSRKDPFTGKRARHEGIDIAAALKTPVHATAPGVVKRAFTNGAYGKFIEIEHEAGFMTRYAHLSEILVKKGDVIQTGDKIGLTGNTGRSTGPHLHYEILIGKNPVNPYRFLRTQRGKTNV